MIAGQYIIRYTSVLSNRFDSTAFKKVMPEIYKASATSTTPLLPDRRNDTPRAANNIS